MCSYFIGWGAGGSFWGYKNLLFRLSSYHTARLAMDSPLDFARFGELSINEAVIVDQFVVSASMAHSELDILRIWTIVYRVSLFLRVCRSP